jgi:L-alanine-DL-glutamate epimerase-like enolase superfamily enzyme
MEVVDAKGRKAWGWGETPLSVQWAWPSSLPYTERHQAMEEFCVQLATAWWQCHESGHPLEVGNGFQRDRLPDLKRSFNQSRPSGSHLTHLAALICCSPFDIALHDAFGILHKVPIYDTYSSRYMSSDLSDFMLAEPSSGVDFRNMFPADFLAPEPDRHLQVWHLVGGLDPIEPDEMNETSLNDGYPQLLDEWIDRDGLNCLKVKLRGNDIEWDFDRLVHVGNIAQTKGARWLSADFNCNVREPAYVNEILDRLRSENAPIFDRILYVEQPFAYDLEEQLIDVRSVAQRKPIFMDESAHDWQYVMLGRSLGWNGVALKTCKTQTGAILSLCWAKAHGMAVMVQDLTNPMLAQIPHVMLAAHARTIMGVESNAMQFYPEASNYEEVVHPGVYTRRQGQLDLTTIEGPGFGYRIDQIARPLPSPVAICG